MGEHFFPDNDEVEHRRVRFQYNWGDYGGRCCGCVERADYPRHHKDDEGNVDIPPAFEIQYGEWDVVQYNTEHAIRCTEGTGNICYLPPQRDPEKDCDKPVFALWSNVSIQPKTSHSNGFVRLRLGVSDDNEATPVVLENAWKKEEDGPPIWKTKVYQGGTVYHETEWGWGYQAIPNKIYYKDGKVIFAGEGWSLGCETELEGDLLEIQCENTETWWWFVYAYRPTAECFPDPVGCCKWGMMPDTWSIELSGFESIEEEPDPPATYCDRCDTWDGTYNLKRQGICSWYYTSDPEEYCYEVETDENGDPVHGDEVEGYINIGLTATADTIYVWVGISGGGIAQFSFPVPEGQFCKDLSQAEGELIMSTEATATICGTQSLTAKLTAN